MLARTPKALGAAARDRRQRLGWTQQQLADAMDVTRKWVNEFENGKGTVQVRLMFDALSALGLSLDLREVADRADD